MDIRLRGHDYRYAAHQALISYLPDFGGAGDALLSGLEEGRAEARLSFGGKEYAGEAVLEGPLPEEPLLRKRAQQRLVRLSVFRACVSALGRTPPWGSFSGGRPGTRAARRLE